MRLCGISSRFQLLSPCIRQVTHALLTRPPLNFKSLGFIKVPFDLHVLGTPPAFILSQDQTLMLNVVCSSPVLSGFPDSVLLYSFRLFQTVRFLLHQILVRDLTIVKFVL